MNYANIMNNLMLKKWKIMNNLHLTQFLVYYSKSSLCLLFPVVEAVE